MKKKKGNTLLLLIVVIIVTLGATLTTAIAYTTKENVNYKNIEESIQKI